MLSDNFLGPEVVTGAAGGIVLAGLLALVMLQSSVCAAGPATNENAGPVFTWSNKLPLSKDQYELIRLYDKLDGADLAKKTELNEKIKQLAAQLGTNAIRRANSRELIATKTATNVVSIHNPSLDNVAFTASIRGDGRVLDSRQKSIGHDTYLPANGTLIVTNLYWTMPSMAGATNK